MNERYFGWNKSTTSGLVFRPCAVTGLVAGSLMGWAVCNVCHFESSCILFLRKAGQVITTRLPLFDHLHQYIEVCIHRNSAKVNDRSSYLRQDGNYGNSAEACCADAMFTRDSY